MNGAQAFTGWIGKMENPDKIEFVHRFIQSLYEQLNALDEELQTLKNKTESERVEELKVEIKQQEEKIDKLRNAVSFGFTESELKKAEEWFREHCDKFPSRPLKKNPDHWYIFEITPTPLGLFKSVKCKCGESCFLGED